MSWNAGDQMIKSTVTTASIAPATLAGTASQEAFIHSHSRERDEVLRFLPLVNSFLVLSARDLKYALKLSFHKTSAACINLVHPGIMAVWTCSSAVLLMSTH